MQITHANLLAPRAEENSRPANQSVQDERWEEARSRAAEDSSKRKPDDRSGKPNQPQGLPSQPDSDQQHNEPLQVDPTSAINTDPAIEETDELTAWASFPILIGLVPPQAPIENRSPTAALTELTVGSLEPVVSPPSPAGSQLDQLFSDWLQHVSSTELVGAGSESADGFALDVDAPPIEAAPIPAPESLPPASGGLTTTEMVSSLSDTGRSDEHRGIVAQPSTSITTNVEMVSSGLVEQVQLSEIGDSKVLTLQLHPAELGQVTLHVEWDQDSLKARILTNEIAANEMLNQSKQQMVQALAEQGISFDSLEVAYEGADQSFDEPAQQDAPLGDLAGEDQRSSTEPVIRRKSNSIIDIVA